MNTNNTQRLAGKTAVVTGGSTGIGFFTAKAFLDHGAKVIITGKNPDRLNAALEKLKNEASSEEHKGRVHAVKADVRSLGQLTALAEETNKIFDGRLDILFVNSGVGGKLVPVEEVTEELFDFVMGTNFKGAFFTVQKLSPLFTNGSSVIFNLSAIHNKPAPFFSIYAASKAAGRSLVRSLAVHFAPKGVRVNSVSPGVVPTEIGKDEDPEKMKAVLGTIVTQFTPFKRPGTSEEIANSVLFLASDESSYVTGSDIFVDGGMSA